MIARLLQQLRERDPERDGFRKALRAAIFMPIAAAASFAVAGDTQTPIFTILGSIALLIAADFPGSLGTRALGYCGLAFNGVVLITVGTLAAPHPWVAVPLCFGVGVLVSFLGLLSEVVTGGQRATLMVFVLPVCIKPVAPLGDRLFGWVIALLLCVPAALFILPPRYDSELRRQATRVCVALADRIEGSCSANEISAAMDAFRTGLFNGGVRPVAMTAGSRALVRVVSDLRWLCDRVDSGTGALLGPMTAPATRVLRACAVVLSSHDPAEAQTELDNALVAHRAVAVSLYRDDVAAILADPDDATAVQRGRSVLSRRTMNGSIGLTGRIILAAVAADTRPLWARLLGRQLPETGIADRVYTKRAAFASLRGYLRTGSVTVLNSLRTGLALALAVVVTIVFPVQNGLWVVLGALSVLRTSALTTGTTALRAVAGTVIGFIIGAVVIGLLGVDPVAMWLLLPLVAFGSTYVSQVGSFLAGQVMFTMMVFIVFNLIQPTGWQVGLIRIEDIVLGAMVGLTASLLLWPRGATAAVQRAIDAALEVSSRYLDVAVSRITRGASEQSDDAVVALSRETLTAVRTYGDAVRNYLSEGAGVIDTGVLDNDSRIPRIRTAADLIADLIPPPLDVYSKARKVLEERTSAVCDLFLHGHPASTLPPISDDFIPALRAEARDVDLAVSAALPLVTTAANIGELELTYPAMAKEPVG
ncbi:FUSC family protein [Mycolicibacterium sp.]|uniref:FUSC family protein n=1 Tax=Mycolicibacterium sp. TaxID=2320850 RepID=UPI001A21D3A1|nr:FUSC family protein [Mycolicibacterium sp.]MBJ7399159.1 FUSC family protein [Mycolicibacterium sp.]